MINLRISIQADQADELADAFAFIVDRGVQLRPVPAHDDHAPLDEPDVVDLAAHRISKQQAAAPGARAGGRS